MIVNRKFVLTAFFVLVFVPWNQLWAIVTIGSELEFEGFLEAQNI